MDEEVNPVTPTPGRCWGAVACSEVSEDGAQDILRVLRGGPDIHDTSLTTLQECSCWIDEHLPASASSKKAG